MELKMIVKIKECDKKELIDTIWEIDEDSNFAKCIEPKDSIYTAGFKVHLDELGFFKSEKLSMLCENSENKVVHFDYRNINKL